MPRKRPLSKLPNLGFAHMQITKFEGSRHWLMYKVHTRSGERCEQEKFTLLDVTAHVGPSNHDPTHEGRESTGGWAARLPSQRSSL